MGCPQGVATASRPHAQAVRPRHSFRVKLSVTYSMVLDTAALQTLQVLQWIVLDQCSSKVNQALTLLSYIHIAFQPLVFNEFVWGQPQAAFNRPVITPYADSVMHKSIRRLTLAGAVLMLAKAAPGFVRFLGLGHREIAAVLGETASRVLAGTSTWCDRGGEALCGRQLCSFTGRTHIGWALPMIPQR